MQIKLGLHDPPTPLYLFVGEGDDGETAWYKLNAESGRVPVPERALSGYLTGLKMCMKEHRGKQSAKLDIHLRGDRPYVIRSGVDTTFSRGVLLALEQLDDAGFFQSLDPRPITIVVRTGDNSKVILGDVYDAQNNEKKVWADWNDKKLLPLINQLQRSLGQEAQTWDDVKATLNSNGNNGHSSRQS